MYLTGFADEAADSLAEQIEITQTLGWRHIEARSVDGVNLNDLDDDAFLRSRDMLGEAGIGVNCLGSTIANWGRQVDEPFDRTLADVDRAIVRMTALDCALIRIMSYAVLRDNDGRALPDQLERERFRRLREICRRFTDAGVTPLHENCLSYGGMSWTHCLRLVDNVPGLKLVFDTGNPPLTPDFTTPFPYAMQSSWEFYSRVREHVAYVHVKDSRWNASAREEEYHYPGEGEGDVKRIVSDLLARGYDGGISMEPHMAVVFHDESVRADSGIRRANYLEYARRFMAMLADVRRDLTK